MTGIVRRETSRIITLVLAITFSLVACSSAQPLYSNGSNIQGTYEIDPIFTEFYTRLGDGEILGPAISPLFWQGQLRMQYIETGLMVYDPLAIPNYYLAPLGLDLGYSDPISENLGQPTDQYVGGHTIYDNFFPMYEKLGGQTVVGDPLTEVRHNVEKMRIEQHFENLGLYQYLDDPTGQVYLLAYGAFACDFSCTYAPPTSAIIEREINLPEPFASAARILGIGFIGEPLAGPHVAADGNVEIIFENLVIYVDPNNPNRVIVRPIVEQIGFVGHQPVERMNTNLVIFFPVADGKGYNIPIIFNDFLGNYGGLDITGLPISELFQLEDKVFRQCYSNLCLDYYESRDENSKITVAPLGAIYMAYTLQSDGDGGIAEVAELPSEIQIRIWEESVYLTSLEKQILYVSVFDSGIPLFGYEPLLTLTLPDGSQNIYRLASTDVNGISFITIPPVPATNGTLIFYEVCVENPITGFSCAQDSYLIWGNP